MGLVFDRYARRCRDVDRVLRRAYLMGVSTRDGARLAEQLWGGRVSHQTVSQLGRWLDDRLAAYRGQAVEAVYPVVQLDGMYVTVGGRKQVVMLAVGLRKAGRTCSQTRHIRASRQGRGPSPTGLGPYRAPALDFQSSLGLNRGAADKPLPVARTSRDGTTE